MDKEELAKRAEEFGQRYTKLNNDGDGLEGSAYVDDATEVLKDGEPTGVFFFIWKEWGYAVEDAGFAFRTGRDLSIQLPGEIYHRLCDDPKKVLNAFHTCLIDYVASGECDISHIPEEVRAMFPDLETEIVAEEARQAAGEDTLKKMIHDDEFE